MNLSSTTLDNKIENFLTRKFKQFPEIDEANTVSQSSVGTLKPHQLGS